MLKFYESRRVCLASLHDLVLFRGRELSSGIAFANRACSHLFHLKNRADRGEQQHHHRMTLKFMPQIEAIRVGGIKTTAIAREQLDDVVLLEIDDAEHGVEHDGDLAHGPRARTWPMEFRQILANAQADGFAFRLRLWRLDGARMAPIRRLGSDCLESRRKPGNLRQKRHS
jgi:hypothetical protein